MVTATEAAANAQTQMAATLGSGLATLSNNQEITFTQYRRLVLPLDGSVFWVRSAIINPAALYNANQFNAAAFNALGGASVNPPAPITVAGSLHYSTSNAQDEAATFSTNRVVFSTQTEIEDLADIGPTTAYIGEIDGLRFMFSQRGKFYAAANVNHYMGDAIFSKMATQIVDDASQLDVQNVVVSNSLPLWLPMTQYGPVFPSYLVPDNFPPPYIVAHVQPGTTEPYSNAPILDKNSNQTQLCKERVRFTTYGLRNNQAQDFLQLVLTNSMATNSYGIVSSPVWQDEKEGQVEFGAIAQKKTCDVDISYYQSRVRDIAQQYILHALITETYGA